MIKIYLMTILVMAFFITSCREQNRIGGDRDDHGCLVAAGYSFDADVGACTRSWELDEHEKEVVRNVLLVQSYSSYTVVSVEKVEVCDDCYDVTLQRNPIDEETQQDKYLEPIVIPYREGRIDYSYDDPSILSVCGNGICEPGEADECPACYNSQPPCLAPCTKGTCNDDCVENKPNGKLRAIDCTDPRPEVCTEEYSPVCGQFDSTKVQCVKFPCGATYGNACLACADEKVVSWFDGVCE
ncbi:MAG: hypothetical protein KKF44_09835 [Nanoarchaeota archaeon]|nr:hypothetical protein [Nanoarchaeota archaeon]